MRDELLVQGRKIKAEDLEWIRHLIAGHGQWGRSHLSVHIAQKWNWRNEIGRLKDMAARTMLLKLERRGLIKLPARQRSGPTNHKSRRVEPDQTDLDLVGEELIEGSLAELLPLQVVLVEGASRRRLFSRLLQHSGTSYRAANWIYVGQTPGRGRQGPGPHIRSASIKDIYVLPLHGRFRQSLCRSATPRPAPTFGVSAGIN